MTKFDGFRKTGSDQETEDRIARHCEKFHLGPLDAVKMFPALARRQWLKRFLAHAELFDNGVYRVLDARAIVARRDNPGSTAPKRVRAALRKARRDLAKG